MGPNEKKGKEIGLQGKEVVHKQRGIQKGKIREKTNKNNEKKKKEALE